MSLVPHFDKAHTAQMPRVTYKIFNEFSVLTLLLQSQLSNCLVIKKYENKVKSYFTILFLFV